MSTGHINGTRGYDRGAITLGCIFTLAVLAAAGYMGWNFGLPFYHKWAFEDQLFATAEQTFHGERSEAVKKIIETGLHNGIAITAENISIQDTNSSTTIVVTYAVPVVTPVYSYTYHFQTITTRNFTR
jgi:hypothetical protein